MASLWLGAAAACRARKKSPQQKEAAETSAPERAPTTRRAVHDRGLAPLLDRLHRTAGTAHRLDVRERPALHQRTHGREPAEEAAHKPQRQRAVGPAGLGRAANEEGEGRAAAPHSRGAATSPRRAGHLAPTPEAGTRGEHRAPGGPAHHQGAVWRAEVLPVGGRARQDAVRAHPRQQGNDPARRLRLGQRRHHRQGRGRLAGA